MATYTELRGLFANNLLKNRIEVACLVAAEAIRVEDGGTVNNANRLIWAKAAFNNPTAKAAPMLKRLLAANKDSTVENIQAVIDSALQVLVDAAVDLFADGN